MKIITAQQNNIQIVKDAVDIKEISKGFSPDKKYIIMSANNEKYLFRTGDIKEYERKKIEFQILNEMVKCNVQAQRPIEIGILEEEGVCYSIFSYLEGEDAKRLLSTYSPKEQYDIGIEAGKDLAKMHTLEAPKNILPWYERAMKKHRKYLEAYKTCGIKIENDDKIIKFIDENEMYVKDRPNRFQHDDFHLENIIVRDGRYVGVVDFNGYDWGDPLHDFVKIALFARDISIPYSIGQIEGYFNERIPEEFWKLYAVYVGMTVFSSVVWTLRAAPHMLEDTLERLHIVLEDHKNFELSKPIWFQPDKMDMK
ncbi:aminoglycoside phosphotransferase [Bacillus thuringiensis]|uniref:Aminoglycoside phosphotransferase n=2 Tax=Bacillus cereus group TaxID=86661 RepID=A0A9X6Z2D5_BACTU|nr:MULTISPECIES: phosphotransferase [Bacillus]AJQ58901.1 aminoglycoside phosphotransferase [Bacillus thuringiensis serovar morrisoni]AMR84649.1 aminoglycoside phosphotransferase [Bacillus thuringiensis]EOO08040.1 aminoglycoside phosphotransferase [Bacillus cereus str. Schrouff]EOO85333.1 aminoglycoside phosphotransferase [Bacillus cereus K-5975c]EOP89358.1 aminoglycoside phosphotransferase [Bacillus cereus HuB4-4]